VEDLKFNADGSIEAYKTNFFKQLSKDLSSDKVFLIKIGEKHVAFCCDEESHMCDICLKMKNTFLEFKNRNVTRICPNCIEIMSNTFQELGMK
jgi:hypothetical protein